MVRAESRAGAGKQRLACASRVRCLFRPVVVGEAPSRTSDPARPITGACGRRLAALAGLPELAFRRRFVRLNLLAAWPGPSGSKGTAWRPAEARLAAERLRSRSRNRFIVLLGRRVGAAFGLGRADYFLPYRVGSALAVVVPHPSGINRWYNASENVRAMGGFLRALSSEDRMTKGQIIEKLQILKDDTASPATASALGEIIESLRADLDIREKRKAKRKNGGA